MSSTVASFCRNCGKQLTEGEKATASIYCGVCAPQFTGASPGYAPPPPPPGMTPMADPNVSPGLAFLLGLIPGVGAIYNGQYAKGLVHVFIFGTLISIASASHDMEALLGFLVAGFYFYMPFEAYHTAQRRQRGLPVDEFSSILPLKGKSGGYPAGPIMMIVVGVLFLLNNLGLLRISQVLRLWPAGLIALGIFLLRDRLRPEPPAAPPSLYDNGGSEVRP